MKFSSKIGFFSLGKEVCPDYPNYPQFKQVWYISCLSEFLKNVEKKNISAFLEQDCAKLCYTKSGKGIFW